MKIAYIFDQVLPDTAADNEQVMHTVSALSHLPDVEVTLFLPARNGETNADATALRAFYHVDGNFSVERFHSIFPANRIAEKLAHPLICARYRRILKKFDVIYCRNIPVVWMALMLKIPVVFDTYRPWPEQYPILNGMFKAFFSNPLFLGMTLHSDYSRQRYLKLGVPEEKTCTAYNGFDQKEYEPELTKAEARRQCGLPVEGKIVMYSGRMEMRKGLADVFALAQARPDVTFVFIGSTGQGEAETIASRLDNCIMLGWMKYGALSPYLYAADVLIIPPTVKPLKKVGNTVLPIKLYAYFGAGRAIFAPKAPDTAELLKHDHNAWLVEPDDPQAALDGFNQLIDNDELLNKISMQAHEDAQKLTWDARAKKVASFMKERLASLH